MQKQNNTPLSVALNLLSIPKFAGSDGWVDSKNITVSVQRWDIKCSVHQENMSTRLSLGHLKIYTYIFSPAILLHYRNFHPECTMKFNVNIFHQWKNVYVGHLRSTHPVVSLWFRVFTHLSAVNVNFFSKDSFKLLLYSSLATIIVFKKKLTD